MNHAQHKPIVFIISAPSGSGKSTLVAELLKTASALDFSISYTTRDPRGREKNGKHYFFVPQHEFERMIRANEFLEYANVFGITMERHAASCARRNRTGTSCCWTSMCRVPG